MPDPMLARLADVLVAYSTEVKKGDLVVIAGRGHLRHLVQGKRQVAFDDAAVARQLLRRLTAPDPDSRRPRDQPAQRAHSA